jgi:ADP-heptose:LPS heptosyltransferase
MTACDTARNLYRASAPRWLRVGAALARCCRGPASRPAILVVKLDSLGDALLFTGALRVLRARFPEHRIVVAASAGSEAVYERLPYIDRLVTIPSRSLGGTSGKDRWERLLAGARLLATRYVQVVVGAYTCGLLEHHIAAFAGGRKTWFAGEVAPDQRDLLPASPQALYDHCIEVDKGMHELDKAAALVSALVDIKQTRRDVWPELTIRDAEGVWARNLANGLRQGADTLVVAVCAGARYQRKCWPVERYGEVLVSLAKRRSVAALLLGTASERKAFEPIVAAGRSGSRLTVLNLAGETDLWRAAAMIQAADLCIGNDTFGLHAAIAAGTPSVVIMSGTDPGRWVPWGDPSCHAMVSHRLSCYGCELSRPCTGECIRAISVTEALAATKTVLSCRVPAAQRTRTTPPGSEAS